MEKHQCTTTTVSLNENEISIALIRQACLPLCGSKVDLQFRYDEDGTASLVGAKVSCNEADKPKKKVKKPKKNYR